MVTESGKWIMKKENIIIGTSCYANAHSGNLVSITGDGGNAWNFLIPLIKN